MPIYPPSRRPLPEALALGPALLALARSSRAPQLAASLVEGPAVVLGAAQRAGRVIDLGACVAQRAPAFRRATTGTAAFLGAAAVIWTVALPHVASLAPDATPRTLLNRNVRGLLKGFTHAGALAHYFGREWIAVRHRPAALLGVEAERDGAVLIEAFAGYDTSLAIPRALAAPEELALDRWLGKAPASLVEVLPAAVTIDEIARAVLDAVAQRAAVQMTDAEAPALVPVARIEASGDPVPSGAAAPVTARVPIGWIEAAALASASGQGGVWLGGDLLTARWLLEDLGVGGVPALSEASSAPLEGALLADLIELRGRACSVRA